MDGFQWVYFREWNEVVAKVVEKLRGDCGCIVDGYTSKQAVEAMLSNKVQGMVTKNKEALRRHMDLLENSCIEFICTEDLVTFLDLCTRKSSVKCVLYFKEDGFDAKADYEKGVALAIQNGILPDGIFDLDGMNRMQVQDL